jgi:hypothetical protein
VEIPSWSGLERAARQLDSWTYLKSVGNLPLIAVRILKTVGRLKILMEIQGIKHVGKLAIVAEKPTSRGQMSVDAVVTVSA